MTTDFNFQCNICDYTFFVSRFRVMVNNDLSITYKDKWGKIKCSSCKSEDVTGLSQEGNFNTFNIGKFSSLNAAGKKEVLQKRARLHSRKTADERRAKVKQADNNMIKSFKKETNGR